MNKKTKKIIEWATAFVAVLLAALIIFAIVKDDKKNYDSKVAVNSDRTVILSDYNLIDTSGEDIDGLSDVANLIKIRSNGFFAGISQSGQVYTNSIYNNEISSWAGITDVAVGYDFIIGLKNDKTLIAAGENADGQCDIKKFTNVKEVKAGAYHTVCLSYDGKIYTVGNNDCSQRDILDWKNVVKLECGPYSTYGILKNGSIITTEKDKKYDFSKFKNIKALSVSLNHVVGVKKDGTVVATGDNKFGQCDVSEFKNIVAVKTSVNHTVLVSKTGEVFAVGKNDKGQCDVKGEKWNIKI